jgi:acetate kinase
METEPEHAAGALAPPHQPHNLKPIRIITQLRRDIPQVACFDTMCHNMWTDASQALYPR